MEPAGVGVIFAPGQILDPVNDLIERFSWVMLASTSSLGLQSLLLKVFSSPGFSLLVALAVVAALLLWWWPQLTEVWRKRVYRLAAVLLMLRFLIPALSISSEGFYQLFLASEYDASSAHLSQTRDTLGRLNVERRRNELLEQEISWYDSLRRDIQSTLDSMDVDRHVVALQVAVENLSEHAINLIVIFAVQTVLFPLLFLWLAVHSIKAVIRLR